MLMKFTCSPATGHWSLVQVYTCTIDHIYKYIYSIPWSCPHPSSSFSLLVRNMWFLYTLWLNASAVGVITLQIHTCGICTATACQSTAPPTRRPMRHVQTDTGKETTWHPHIRWPTSGVLQRRLVAVNKWIMTVFSTFYHEAVMSEISNSEGKKKSNKNRTLLWYLYLWISVRGHATLNHWFSLDECHSQTDKWKSCWWLCVCMCLCVSEPLRPLCGTLFSLSPRTAASNLWPLSIRCIQSPLNRRAAAPAAAHRWGQSHGKHS